MSSTNTSASDNSKNNSKNKNNTTSIEKKNDETETKSPAIMQFSDEEFTLYNDSLKDMNIDNENFDDLKTIPEDPAPIPDKELDRIIKDPKNKVTVTKPGETPSIMNSLGPNDRLSNITDEEIRMIKENEDKDRKKLITLLATKDYINLDIKIGTKEGRSIFLNKSYYFNAMDKKEEFHLKMRNARMTQISHRYTAIANKDVSKWTDAEADFVSLATAMVEVAAYQLSEHEAMLRLGIPKEDFARVEVVQYGLALQVIQWRTANPYSSSLERSYFGSRAKTGKS